MRKNLLKSSGFPMPVDPNHDLGRIAWAASDSWYIKCVFKSNGKQLGFTWHQMINTQPDGTQFVSLESVFMNATDDVWIHKNAAIPVSDTANADADRLNVFTPYGGVTGDMQGMNLTYDFEGQRIDVHLTPTGEIEHQGATGLMDYGSLQSYEYGLVNMAATGTVTIDGVTYPLEEGSAWFDRQYGTLNQKQEPPLFVPGVASWLWLGIDNLTNQGGAVSFGDIYNPGSRMSFATFLHTDGTEVNVDADIKYDDIWTSSKTGFSYPRTISIDVPTEDFNVKLTSMAHTEDIEFVMPGENKGLSGCQCLFKMSGAYHGKKLNHACIVETIGDLCGEA